MADVREMAIGFVSVLASGHAPDPLPLTFWGQSLAEAVSLVLAILSECRDANINIKRLEVDPELFPELEQNVDVPLRAEFELRGEVRFYRAAQE